MRCLGLDLGTKTLGISMSDENAIIASTYKTIHFEENQEDSAIPELKDIINKFNVGTIVLGLPKNMNNTIGPRGEACIEYGNKLKKELNIPVEMQDERLSTVAAHNYMLEADMSRKKRKEKVDSLAANIILQSYLDKKGK
jgi:putative Holliday junction resolvase